MTTATLHTELDKLTPAVRNKIRKLAYQITDAVRPLAMLLESADCDTGFNAGPLLDEHMLYCEVLALLDKSKLTSVL